MKYLIKENTLNQAIYNYIDNWFVDNKVEYSKGYKFAKTDRVILFLSKTGDDILLAYYPFEYFEKFGMMDFYEKAPVLEFTSKDLVQHFDNLFGPFWRSVFEQFFEDTYPRFPVKTFMYK